MIALPLSILYNWTTFLKLLQIMTGSLKTIFGELLAQSF